MSQPRFAIRPDGFFLDGEPTRLFSGEMHYFRIVPQYWRDRLRKARAMGLNAVCTYMCWNLHEPRPGQFDFRGMLDAARFVRLAQEEGLLVLLRPGPYICAEWDLGGLPPWLLADGDIRIRCNNDHYMAAVERYVARVADELGELQISRGGPIIAVQIENEYGSFGNDRVYLRRLADLWRDAGIDVPFFTSDGCSDRMLKCGTLDDALATLNFADPANAQALLRRHRPAGPMMVGEFWDGWFDHWGSPRKGMTVETAVARVGGLLEAGWSLNLYMLHGGTSFGFTSGANYRDGYKPQVTSYDYDAPLDEAGRPTAKYFALRELFAARLSAAQRDALPPLPEPTPTIAIAPFTPDRCAPLWDNLPEPIQAPAPQSMEQFGQRFGFILYRTAVDGLGDGLLSVDEVRDFATVYLNGQRVGQLDRRLGERTLPLAIPPAGPARLDLLVEAMGRVNFGFGSRLLDRKGITEAVQLDSLALMGWQVYCLPMDDLTQLRYRPVAGPAGPAFYRGQFRVERVGDTFLDMSRWGKGVAWVNGHNLGRFWHIGPQQTLYVPAPLLREGLNEVVVFEQLRDAPAELAGLAEPILDRLTAP